MIISNLKAIFNKNNSDNLQKAIRIIYLFKLRRICHKEIFRLTPIVQV